MSTLSRRGLFALVAAPFAALTGARESVAAVSAPTRLTHKPAAVHAKTPAIRSLTAPPHLLGPFHVHGGSGSLQAQITALQNAVTAMQTNENNLWTFAVDTFGFANSVRQSVATTNDSLSSHYHYSETQDGAWILTSGPQF